MQADKIENPLTHRGSGAARLEIKLGLVVCPGAPSLTAQSSEFFNMFADIPYEDLLLLE